MKFVKCLIPLILCTFLFGGCGFQLSSSIDDLISPVTPLGENAKIQESLTEYISGSYTLKTPSDGNYTSSFVLYDIDGDSYDEAFTFYETVKDPGNTKMSVLKQIDKKWQVVTTVNGSGSDISEISFQDVNGDGKKNILVSWELLSNQSSHSLSVYSFTDKNNKCSLKRIVSNLTESNFCSFDYNKDGIMELMLFNIDSTNSFDTSATLVSLKNNNKKEIGSTKLDGNISAYTKLTVENGDTVRIFADAQRKNGSEMITEIVYWSSYYNSLVSPFYSYSNGETKGTSRSNMIQSRDVNNDGKIDIPTDSDFCDAPNGIDIVDWKHYNNSILYHSSYSLVNKQDGYMFIVPDSWNGKINAKYSKKDKKLTLYSASSKKEICSVSVVLKSKYTGKSTDSQVVGSISGYYCIANVSKDSNIKVSLNDLKKCIKDY